MQQIKGQTNIEDQGLELIDMVQLCQMLNIKISVERTLLPMMETFEKNMYGEVSCTDLINAFHKAHIGIFEEDD